jgi:hypothetical protein
MSHAESTTFVADDYVHQELQKRFELPEDYIVVSASYDAQRGGFVAANVTIENQNYEVYYGSGWCSSGGSDCGWIMSITGDAGSSFYSTSKETYCNLLESRSYYDGGIFCTGEQWSNTSQVRVECLNGAFETTTGTRTTLYLEQVANRCEASVVS